jgi:WD40 repeat protein
LKSKFGFVLLLIFCGQVALPQELVVQLGHTSPVIYLEISPDGKQILWGRREGVIILWDFHLGRLIRTYSKKLRTEEEAAAFFQETAAHLKIPVQQTLRYGEQEWKGNRVTVVMNDDQHRGEITDPVSKKKRLFTFPKSSLTQENISINNFALDGSANLMATAHGYVNVFITSQKSDTTVKVIDLNTNLVTTIFPGHRGRTNQVRFTPNNNFIVSAGHDRLIKIWELKSGALINTLGNVADAVMDVDFSSDGKTFATASDNPRTWDFTTASITQLFQGHRDLVSSVVFANDSQMITSSFDKTLKKWDLATGSMNKNFRGHTNRITEISLSGSGKYVASITSSGPELDAVSFNMSSFDKKHSAKIWDPVTGRSLKTLQGRNSIAISPDEKYIVCPGGGYDEQGGIENTKGFKIELFSMPDGQSLGSWPSKGSPAVVAFSPDSKLLVEGSNGARVWKIENGVPSVWYDWTMSGQSGDTKLQADAWYWVTAVAFSKDNKLLAVAENATIKLYDLASGKISQTLVGHVDDVRTLSFSPDGKFLLSGSTDTQLKAWNLLTGKTVATFISLRGSREFVVYTPDGYYMASRGGTQALHFVKGTKVYLFDQFDLQYNRPDIVLARIGLASNELIDSYKKAYEKRVKKLGFNPENFEKERSFNVPEVAIRNVLDYTADTNINSFDVSLEANDPLFLLDRLNVFVNGVPMHGSKGFDLKTKNTKVVQEKINLTLSQGRNIIELSVLNEKGVESLKERFELNYTQRDYKPVLHLVAISVSEYANSTMNLKYAAKDGNDVIGLFNDKIKEDGTFSNVITHPLFNREATRDNILKLKTELQKTHVDDIVLIFVSGHGLLDKNLDYFLATHNVDFANPSQNGLKYDDLESLLDGINARKKILMMDACHSGEIDKEEVEATTLKTPKEGLKFRNFGNQGIKNKNVGLNNSYELSKQLFQDLRKGSGTTVLSAAGGVEVALEGDTWQNGVFTYCLLMGLKEKKADLNQDSHIMLSELQAYLYQEVSNVTNGKQRPTSRIENLIIDWKIW